MSKFSTALWKGVKHGLTTAVASVAVAIQTGTNPKTLPLVALYGFLAGIGINVHAIKEAK